MNYLAHAFLAGQEPGLVLGSLVGDFVKGRVENVPDTGIRAGVKLHRAVDVFTDGHPITRRSRIRLAPERRRYAGIVVDMVYDHLLAANWDKWDATTPLAVYTASLYELVESSAPRLPSSFLAVFPRMRANDWLASYESLDHIERALNGIATRVRGGERLHGAITDVHEAYDGLQMDFEAFFPALCEHAVATRDELLRGNRGAQAEPPASAQ